MLSESTSSFQCLKDPTWPDKHVLKKMVPQPTMKQRLKHNPHQQQHENYHPNNILSGDQPLQVLNYQLERVETNKLVSLNWHFNTAKGFPNITGY